MCSLYSSEHVPRSCAPVKVDGVQVLDRLVLSVLLSLPSVLSWPSDGGGGEVTIVGAFSEGNDRCTLSVCSGASDEDSTVVRSESEVGISVNGS